MKTTNTAPMQTQRSTETILFPIDGMRLLDGETPEQIAAREAAAAEAARVAAEAATAEAARLEAERVAAEAAEVARLAAEKAKLEQDRKDGKLTDKEFELLTDAMKHKATAKAAQKALEEATNKLKSFEGIDPAKIKDLVKAEVVAKEAARKAELKAAEKAGDVERIKKMMADEHEKVVGTIKQELATKDGQLKSAEKTIEDLTVGAAFTQSAFVQDELVLTPQIARQVYGTHFDVVNGKITPFDKPRGESGRTPLVNASGQALSLDEAVKKLVESSPDKDKLLRSKLSNGANSRTEKTRAGTETTGVDELRGVARITAALNSGQLKKPGAK